MASEAFIQSVMQQFGGMPAGTRENLLASLLAAKAKTVLGDDASLVGDPKLLQMLKPIMDNPTALDGAIEALTRLEKQDKKKGGFFSFLKR